jgi:uncharacterized membrane protein YdjX (TVP38/TMEM64 family)
LLLVVIGGICFLAYQFDFIKLFLSKKKLSQFLESLGPWSTVAFVALQAIQVVAAPIPGEATGILGGFLYGPYLGTLLSTIGLTIGSLIAFVLARYLGRPFAERFISAPTMERFDYLLHHKGVFLIFVLFLIPGFPKDALCYLLGLGHLSIMEFLLIGGVGRLLGTLLLTLQGNFLRLQQYGSFYSLVAVGVLIIVLVLIYKDRLERLLRQWYIKKHPKKDSSVGER